MTGETLGGDLAPVPMPPTMADIKAKIIGSSLVGAALVTEFAPIIGRAGLGAGQLSELEALVKTTAGKGVSIAAVRSEIKLATPVVTGGADSDMQQSEAADIIAGRIDGAWLWDSTGQSWFTFVGPHWQECDPDRFSLACKHMVTEIVGKFSSAYLTGVDKMVRIEASQDAPWCDDRAALPFKNGVLNLETGELETFGSRRFNWCLPVEYDAAAVCPVFVEWIEFLSAGNIDDQMVLECTLAAIVRGMWQLQVFFEVTGQGGTGKGAYQHLARALIGADNTIATDLGNLGRNQFETSRLYGKRLAVIADADEFKGNMGTLKRLTGGDPIRLERKRENARSFIFTGMVMITGNQSIEGNDLSSGLFRRRVPLSFTREPEHVDRDFYEKLTNELPGIIARLTVNTEQHIEAVIKRHRGGDAAQAVLKRTNSLAAFISDVIESDPDGGEIMIGRKRLDERTGEILDADAHIFPAYLKWCDEDGGVRPDRVLGKRNFASKLVDNCKMLGMDVMVYKATSGPLVNKQVVMGIRFNRLVL